MSRVKFLYALLLEVNKFLKFFKEIWFLTTCIVFHFQLPDFAVWFLWYQKFINDLQSWFTDLKTFTRNCFSCG